MNSITQAILNKSKLEVDLIKISDPTKEWVFSCARLFPDCRQTWVFFAS